MRADRKETAALLARTAILRLCNAAELDELAATAYPMSFEPGDAPCLEGSDSNECYAIAGGEAHVTIDARSVRSVGERMREGVARRYQSEPGVALDAGRRGNPGPGS